MSLNPGSNGPGGDLPRNTATSSLSGSNSAWIESLYERYLAGEEIPEDWRRYFASFAAIAAGNP